MFSGALIGALVAASAGTWVYTKSMRQTGNNTQQAAIIAGLAALVAFIVTLTLVVTVNKLTGN